MIAIVAPRRERSIRFTIAGSSRCRHRRRRRMFPPQLFEVVDGTLSEHWRVDRDGRRRSIHLLRGAVLQGGLDQLLDLPLDLAREPLLFPAHLRLSRPIFSCSRPSFSCMCDRYCCNFSKSRWSPSSVAAFFPSSRPCASSIARPACRCPSSDCF